MIYAIHPVGKLTVTPEGAYLRFHAEAPQAAGLLRVHAPFIFGAPRCAFFTRGVYKFTSSVQAFPATIILTQRDRIAGKENAA